MQSLGRGTRGPCAEGCWCAWLCAAAAVCAVVAEAVALIIALWLAVLVVSSDALAVIFTVVSIPSVAAASEPSPSELRCVWVSQAQVCSSAGVEAHSVLSNTGLHSLSILWHCLFLGLE